MNPDMTAGLKLSTRLDNVLLDSHFTSLDALSAADPKDVELLRNMGETSMLELAIALRKKFLKPRWLPYVAHKFEFDTITPEQAKERHYRSITSGYSRKEQDMLVGVIADMERDGCDYVLVRQGEFIEVHRPGDKVRVSREDAGDA